MRYKGLDLNLLYALDVLLEVRNVSRAAERLGLSQSALSAALARLRAYFSDDLLVIDGRRMHPTPYAEQIIVQVRACLATTDTLLATSRSFDPTTAIRTFRIICSDYVVASVFVRVAQHVAATAPGVRLEFVLPDESASERLHRGEIDLLIAPTEFLQSGHPMEELYEETHVVAGWRDNPIFQKPIGEDAFFEACHVAVSVGGHRTASLGDRQIELMRRNRRIDVIVSSFTMIPLMLIGTQRLALMHRRLAEVMSIDLPITFAPLPFALPSMYEMAQYHRARQTDVGLRWLIEEVQSAARSTPEKYSPNR